MTSTLLIVYYIQVMASVGCSIYISPMVISIVLQHTIHERTITTSHNLTLMESILEICSVNPKDSGQYLCTARNAQGSASAANRTNILVTPGGFYMPLLYVTLCVCVCVCVYMWVCVCALYLLLVNLYNYYKVDHVRTYTCACRTISLGNSGNNTKWHS